MYSITKGKLSDQTMFLRCYIIGTPRRKENIFNNNLTDMSLWGSVWWSNQCNKGTIFAAARSINKSYLAWAELYANIISNLSNIDSTRTGIVTDIFLASLNRIYHNWTCVLLIVDSPNAKVNISNVLAHWISFFTQYLIQLL